MDTPLHFLCTRFSSSKRNCFGSFSRHYLVCIYWRRCHCFRDSHYILCFQLSVKRSFCFLLSCGTRLQPLYHFFWIYLPHLTFALITAFCWPYHYTDKPQWLERWKEKSTFWTGCSTTHVTLRRLRKYMGLTPTKLIYWAVKAVLRKIVISIWTGGLEFAQSVPCLWRKALRFEIPHLLRHGIGLIFWIWHFAFDNDLHMIVRWNVYIQFTIDAPGILLQRELQQYRLDFLLLSEVNWWNSSKHSPPSSGTKLLYSDTCVENKPEYGISMMRYRLR